MITINKLEGKDQEVLLNGLNKNMIHYKYNEIPAKLFKQKKYELVYLNVEDVKTYIKKFVEELAKSLKCEINTEINFEKEIYNVSLSTEDNSLLIGKDGRTLNSIQLLLHQILNNLTGFNLRINVDSSNYKEKKLKRFEKEIRIIAKEVKNSKIEAKLDMMNSYERRMVHSIVSEYTELRTKSEGEEPNRYVIISYKED